MMPASTDLLLISAWMVGAELVVLLDIRFVLLRVVFGAPLVLLLPGYGLVCALFPHRLPRLSDRLVMSGALSLTITGLLGLLLHYTAAGIQTWSWVLALVGITTGTVIAAMLRRRRFVPSVVRLSLHAWQMALFGGLVVAALAAIAIGRWGVTQQPWPGFTQLSALPVSDISDTPLARLTIQNAEHEPMTYRLQVLNRGQVLNEWSSITLQPGERWQRLVSLPNAEDEPAEILLYRTDTPAIIYRRAVLWTGSANAP